MVIEKEDLGLSLSLSMPQNPNHIEVSNCTSSSLPSTPPFNLFQKASWPATFIFSDRSPEACKRVEHNPYSKGFDVNMLPSTMDAEEEAGVSSPNSTISSLSGKRSERDLVNNGEEIETERTSSRGVSDEEDVDNSRKKLRLSKDQSIVLEESFKEHSTLNPKQKLALARRLGLRARQVEVWFQNRRARTKLKQSEVDCEYLKRCCESLTEENRRLQKEVQELRALKLSPKLYMHMNPPTTLNMCPSCERVVVPPPLTTPSSTPSFVEPGARQMVPRPVAVNPWAGSPPMSHRPFDALHTRS